MIRSNIATTGPSFLNVVKSNKSTSSSSDLKKPSSFLAQAGGPSKNSFRPQAGGPSKTSFLAQAGGATKKRARDASDFAKQGAKQQKLGLSDPSRSQIKLPEATPVETKKSAADEEEEAMQREVEKLKGQLHKSKEKTDYWRRKSFDIETALSLNKVEAKRDISSLEEKIEEMTAARLQLQAKLEEDTATNEKAMDEIAGLLETQENLEKDKQLLIEEIQTLQSACDEASGERQGQIEELKTCLQETLGDLKTKLAELTSAKEALKRAKQRTKELQAAAIASNTKVDSEANEALKQKCGRREQRITNLTNMVEKLVFKASVLSQTNSELETKVAGGGSKDPSDLGTSLPGVDKLAILEKMCLKRYAKILKQAAGRVYEAKHANSNSAPEEN